MENESIRKFYDEICRDIEGDYKIILGSKRDLEEDWIEYDEVKWEIEEPLQSFVNNLLKDKRLSLEEKILEVYQFICLNYVYDANVLYFFKKDVSDPNNVRYIAVDWYGRIVGEDWIKNRKKHNRRICYEFARFYAKSINKLLEGNTDLEALMIGDKENLHYVVGLTGKEYSVILDLDDFNDLKDLTRLKMGLTIKGIRILRDENGIFKKAVDKFNNDRLVELKEIEEARENLKNKDFILYINEAIKAINKYDIDPQGFFEYTRFLIEESGIKIEKIWKEDKNANEKRYERCLYFEYNNKTYLLDSITKELSIINLDELDRNLYIFNSSENQYEYYGG